MARWRRNAATTGAWPRPEPVPLPPGQARRSCALPAAASPGNNHAAAPPDPHARSPRRAHQHRLQTVPAVPRSRPVPPKTTLLRVARTVTQSVRVSDTVRLARASAVVSPEWALRLAHRGFAITPPG